MKVIGCNQAVRHRVVSVDGRNDLEILPCNEPVRFIDGDRMYCEEHYKKLMYERQRKLDAPAGDETFNDLPF